MFISKRLHILCNTLVVLISLCSFSCYATKFPKIKWGLSARQGRRPTMEDAHDHKENFRERSYESFFAVYDGHGGKEAGQYTTNKLRGIFESLIKDVHDLNSQQIRKALEDSFEEMEKSIIKEKITSGTTAVVAYQRGNKVYFAWVGDSRGLVLRNGKVIFTTYDHKPDHPLERKRIEKVGERVQFDLYGCPRVRGLAMSRSLGDPACKAIPGAVISRPSVRSVEIQKGDIIVLACDGVFDVLSNEQVAQLMQKMFEKSLSTLKIYYPTRPTSEELHENANSELLQYMARSIRDTAYYKGSTDNISAMVIQYGTPSWSKLINSLQKLQNGFIPITGTENPKIAEIISQIQNGTKSMELITNLVDVIGNISPNLPMKFNEKNVPSNFYIKKIIKYLREIVREHQITN